MTNENFEKINTEGLDFAVEKLLLRNNFSYPIGFNGLKEPILAQRIIEVKQGRDKVKQCEFLTLIPIYNFKKDGGSRVWDYRGTVINNELDNMFGTSFPFKFSCVTQLFDFLEEDKW